MARINYVRKNGKNQVLIVPFPPSQLRWQPCPSPRALWKDVDIKPCLISFMKSREKSEVSDFFYFSQPSNPRITGGFSLLVSARHCIVIFSGYLIKFKFRQFPSDEIINVPVLLDAILLQNLLITARIKCTCKHVLAVRRTCSFLMSSQDDKGTLTIKYHQKGNKPWNL